MKNEDTEVTDWFGTYEFVSVKGLCIVLLATCTIQIVCSILAIVAICVLIRMGSSYVCQKIWHKFHKKN